MKAKRLAVLLVLLLTLSLALASCGGGERINEITGVSYSAKTGSLEIEATLDAKTVKEYRRDTIYLIEVPANCASDDITTLIPVSRSKPSGKLSFSLPLHDGARTRLYSGFVLAVFDRENGYVALGDVHYVDNPEALSSNNAPYPEYPSVKGLSIVSSSDALMLGAKHTVIRIPIEDYILPTGSDGARNVTFDGDSHYISSEKIEELDYKIKDLTDAGIEVALEFTLDTPPEELPTTLSVLARKKVKSGASEESAEPSKHYAISVSDGGGYRSLASLFEFFASRYTQSDGKYGFAGTFIIGHGANSEVGDPLSLSQSASNYASLLRLAHTAMLSKYAHGKVFASIDNKWTLPDSEVIVPDEDETPAETEPAETGDPSLDWQKPHGADVMPTALREVFGGEEFLSVVIKEADKGGEFDFGVAVMPNASDGASDIWNDAGATDTDDTPYITMKNISVLGKFLASSRMTYGDTARELFIYDLGISAENESMMAASYAYAYGKALEVGASALIYNGHFDGETGNGETGLFACDEVGTVTGKRQIYGVFRDIDKKGKCEEVLSTLSPGGDWQETRKRIIKEANAVSGESGGMTSLSDADRKAMKKTKSTVLFDFTGGLSCDFYPSDSVLYTEMGELIDKRALKAVLAPRYLGENMGVRSETISADTFDGAKQISAVIRVDLPEGNTCRVNLALSQSSSEGSSFFMSGANVQAGNRQTVYFDVSDAEISGKLGDVRLSLWVESPIGISSYYMGSDASESEVCTLLIESISLAVHKVSLVWLWIVLIIILAVAAYFGCVYFTNLKMEREAARRRLQRRPMQRSGQAQRPQRQMQMQNVGAKGANRGNGSRYYGSNR